MFSSPLQMSAFLKQKILKYCRNINPVQKNIQKVTKYTTIVQKLKDNIVVIYILSYIFRYSHVAIYVTTSQK